MSKIVNEIWNLIEFISILFLKIIFGLLKRPLTDDVEKNFMQFIKFGIIGVSNTVISYLIYSGFLLFFNKVNILTINVRWLGKVDYLCAQLIAFILSVAWSFYWNNKYVFILQENEQRSIWKTLIKTYISYSFTGLFLNTILLIIWVQVIGINEFIAPIINLLISVPLNFIINKLWAFKKIVVD
ncbi:Putative flippase GtrA (transmembrane translocase of bactoprenol-linked glucose) [Lachnospiraceae bacterium A10]|nr:Putative flippase GtrA (transmembrane translocase of bactoprenol-linked glucose) [Lachnospiraceae bacterium A10]